MSHRIVFLFVFLLLYFPVVKAENCSLDHLTDLEYTDIECQFYMGTEAYRHKVYSVAAAHWSFIQNVPSENFSDEELKTEALGTLTYLKYYGFGIEQNRRGAVKAWEQAVKQGGFEARRHLGYAYSDQNYRYRNNVKALGWYESIFLLYPTTDDLSEIEKSIYDDSLEGAEILREKLSPRQIEKALKFARTTL